MVGQHNQTLTTHGRSVLSNISQTLMIHGRSNIKHQSKRWRHVVGQHQTLTIYGRPISVKHWPHEVGPHQSKCWRHLVFQHQSNISQTLMIHGRSNIKHQSKRWSNHQTLTTYGRPISVRHWRHEVGPNQSNISQNVDDTWSSNTS